MDKHTLHYNNNTLGGHTYSQSRDGNWMNNNMLTAIHGLFNRILSTQDIPADWCTSIILPLFKKGDRRDPKCYRFISKMDTLKKVFHTILNRRAIKYTLATGNMCFEQGGFLPKVGTSSQVIALIELCSRRQIELRHRTETINRYNNTGKTTPKTQQQRRMFEHLFHDSLETFIFFLDLKQAFDSIPHDVLFRIMTEHFGIPRDSDFLKYRQAMYARSTSRFECGDTLSDAIPLKRGLPQGDPQSPFEFNIFVNHIIKTIRDMNLGVKIPTTSNNHPLSIASLWYADDGACFTSNSQDMHTLISNIITLFDQYGIKLGYDKCGVMPMFEASIDPQYITTINEQDMFTINETYCHPLQISWQSLQPTLTP